MNFSTKNTNFRFFFFRSGRTRIEPFFTGTQNSCMKILIQIYVKARKKKKHGWMIVAVYFNLLQTAHVQVFAFVFKVFVAF